jgi:hypothetical protein
VPDFEAHQAKNARLSAELRVRLAGHLDLADDEKPLQKVDLFPARPRGKRPTPIFRDFILRAQGEEPFRPAPPHPSRARRPWSTPSRTCLRRGPVDQGLDRPAARRPINPISG